MSDDSDVFNGTLDRYNGITIDTDIAAIDLSQFAEHLESKWKWKFTNKITAKTYSTWLFFFTFAERVGCLLQSLCNIGKRMRIGPFGLKWISIMPASFRFSLRYLNPSDESLCSTGSCIWIFTLSTAWIRFSSCETRLCDDVQMAAHRFDGKHSAILAHDDRRRWSRGEWQRSDIDYLRKACYNSGLLETTGLVVVIRSKFIHAFQQ